MAWGLCACRPPGTFCPEHLLCVTDTWRVAACPSHLFWERTFKLRGKRCDLDSPPQHRPRGACPLCFCFRELMGCFCFSFPWSSSLLTSPCLPACSCTCLLSGPSCLSWPSLSEPTSVPSSSCKGCTHPFPTHSPQSHSYPYSRHLSSRS